MTSVEQTIRALANCHIEKYEEEIINSNRVNLRIRLRFLNGFLIEINEAIVIEKKDIQFLSYRYQFQNMNNQLIFRYDNTPHFPDIETFPHHKHLRDKVIPIKKPSITSFIDEIKLYLLSQNQ